MEEAVEAVEEVIEVVEEAVEAVEEPQMLPLQAVAHQSVVETFVAEAVETALASYSFSYNFLLVKVFYLLRLSLLIQEIYQRAAKVTLI